MEITICGSVDFTPKIIEVKEILENRGDKVNIPYFTQMIIDGKLTYEEYMESKQSIGDIELRREQKEHLILRYWNFIQRSHAILTLNLEKNGIQGYIGGNTLMELGFAHITSLTRLSACKIGIYLYNPIPERGLAMHYVDEIKDIDPTIINGDLSLVK